MESYRKCTNIHINPSFGDKMKSGIHINPKVRGNMAIHVHVNPEVVNKLASAELQQQKLLQSSNIEQPLETYNGINYSVQKSVHVNPKLMQKLTNRVSERSSNEQTHQQQEPTQPKYFPVVEKKNETQKLINSAQHSIPQKSLPSRFVAISKNKLIRIHPETKKQITQTSITNVNNNNCGKSTTLSSLQKVNPLKKVNISPKVSSKTRVTTNRLKTDSKNNKYKIDRTLVQTSKNKSETSPRKPLGTKSNLINIDGVFYKSSKSCLVRSTNLSRLSEKRGCIGNSSTTTTNLNSSRSKKIRKHSLVNKKITIANLTLKSNTGKTGSPAGQRINYKHLMSNRVKQKSLQILRHKMCKNNQPCLLFQRFGYCAKYIDGTCPKVHDKKQVVLCKNFLQGKCLLDNCPLSHEVGPEKMPTCKYFLDGCCTRDSCQYLHVKVSDNTPICVQFLRGYCAKGDKCKERHKNTCPEFDKTGKCPKGKNCPYPHKSSLFAQQKALNGKKKIILNAKPKDDISINDGLKSAMIGISSRDDNSKRYYDESNCDDDKNIEEKKRVVNRQNELMKSIHAESSNNSQSSIVETIDNEMKSQSVDKEERPKRPLIGPLPSYIPIN